MFLIQPTDQVGSKTAAPYLLTTLEVSPSDEEGGGEHKHWYRERSLKPSWRSKFSSSIFSLEKVLTEDYREEINLMEEMLEK